MKLIAPQPRGPRGRRRWSRSFPRRVPSMKNNHSWHLDGSFWKIGSGKGPELESSTEVGACYRDVTVEKSHFHQAQDMSHNKGLDRSRSA